MQNYIERDIFVLRDASSVAQPIEYVQGTNAVPILLHLRDYTIPAGSTARVYVEWPSSKGEYDADGVSVSGNDILIQPKDTLFSEIGKSFLQVCIVKGADTLVTFAYPVFVKRNPVPGIVDPSVNKSDFLDEYIKNMESATQSANEASERASQSADEANAALDAYKGAAEGTVINDETPSAVTTYSSEKIEDALVDIKTTTDSTLYNSKDGGARLVHMDGNSEQKTYSGKNKLNCSGLTTQTTNGVTFTPVYKANGELEYINVNGTATALAQLVLNSSTILDDGKYVMSGCPSGGSDTTYSIRGTRGVYCRDNGSGVNCSQEVNGEPLYIYIEINSGVTVSNLKFYPMIRLATETDPTYEPYVGGMPSPSQAFPQAMNHTGECLETVYGAYYGNNGTHTYTQSQVCSKYAIPCKEGDVIKIECENLCDKYIQTYNNGSFVTQYYYNSNVDALLTIPSGVTHFKFSYGTRGGKTTLTVNDKYIVRVKTIGKNLMENKASTKTVNGITFTVNSDGTITANGTSTDRAQVSLGSTMLRAGTYIISQGFLADNYGALMFANYRDENGITAYVDLKGREHGKFTLAIDTWVSVTAEIRTAGKTVDNKVFYPMIRKVEMTDDTYEPHTEHIEYISLDEPPRKAGDVADQIIEKDGVFSVYRQCKEDALTEVKSVTPIDGGYRINASLSSKGLVSLAKHSLCTVALFNSNWDSMNKFCLASTGTSVYIQVPTDILPNGTVEEAQEWLISNDVRVLYPLETPTFTPLDTESQKALNRLKTFDTVTYIEVDSVIQPSEVEVEYGTSIVGAYTLQALNNTNIDKIERAEMKAQLDELSVALVAMGSEV